MGPTATLSNVDTMIKNEFVPFRERIIDAFVAKHPHMVSVVNLVLDNRENQFGLKVTENGQPVGEYTFHLGGMRINDIENNKLDSAIHHPLLGVVKPYVTMERSAIEKIMADEENLKNDPFTAITKYLPDITINFLH